MSDLSSLQLGLVALIFVWSGFVRAGLGFGGAALTLPLLLLLVNDPILWLPIAATHLLIFSILSIHDRLSNINWKFLKHTMLVLIIPKLIGVLGLLNLPNNLVTNIIYIITILYACTYIFNITISSGSKIIDNILLVLGGYASGVSLIGAPLISAVAVRQVELSKVRDTLFAIWLILVSIKMTTFVMLDVDLQWRYSLYLLPFVGFGHWLGVKAHHYLIQGGGARYKSGLGIALFIISCYGLWVNTNQ